MAFGEVFVSDLRCIVLKDGKGHLMRRLTRKIKKRKAIYAARFFFLLLFFLMFSYRFFFL